MNHHTRCVECHNPEAVFVQVAHGSGRFCPRCGAVLMCNAEGEITEMVGPFGSLYVRLRDGRAIVGSRCDPEAVEFFAAALRRNEQVDLAWYTRRTADDKFWERVWVISDVGGPRVENLGPNLAPPTPLPDLPEP